MGFEGGNCHPQKNPFFIKKGVSMVVRTENEKEMGREMKSVNSEFTVGLDTLFLGKTK